MAKFLKTKDLNTNFENDNDNEESKSIDEEIKEDEIPSKDYDYLLSMPLWSLTEEKIEEL